MESTERNISSIFCNNKGQYISYRNWKTVGKPKGIVLIIHGFNSHSGYYQKFAAQLNGEGFQVYAMDLPGRGLSEGERYYIPDYKDIITDIDQLVDIARSAHLTIPIFLFGHSAGGVLASVYGVHYQDKLQGLISESFALQVAAPDFALSIMKFLSRIIPHTRIVKLDNKDFSRDKTIVKTMNKDPLLTNEKQAAKTIQQLLLAAEYLKEEMHEIRLPLLILHGTGDNATRPEGSRYFMEHAASIDKQLNLYEGHYHDLINDKYNGIVVRDIVRWLKERI